MGRATRDHVTRIPHYAGNNFYIRPNFVVSIPEYVKTDGSKGKVHRNSRLNLERNDPEGNLSAKAASKIRNAVNWLIQAAKPKRVFDKKSGKNFQFRVNFITLTIPACDEIPPDHFVKKEVFHPWIIYARKYFGLRNYVWRAETQANGMIHFHLVTDSFIHHKRLRSSWNKRLVAAGLLSDHISRGGSEDPNSTDVHSVKGIQNLGAYISKYVSKVDDTRRKIKGRLWGCNYELSHNVKTTASCDPDETAQQVRALERAKVEWKQLLSKPDALGGQLSVGELFIIPHKVWSSLKNTPIGQAYFERIFRIRTNHVSMPIEYYTINHQPCQSITQSTQVTGLPKSGPQFLQELKTSVNGAVQKITQLVTEISGNDLFSVTSSNSSGLSVIT